MLDRLLTVEEAAERLGTSVRFVRRLVFERRIAYQARSACPHRPPRPGCLYRRWPHRGAYGAKLPEASECMSDALD